MALKFFRYLIIAGLSFSSLAQAGEVEEILECIRKTRVKSELGAQARVDLANLRFARQIDDSILTINDAIKYLSAVLKTHGTKNDVGARAAVDLSILRLKRLVPDAVISVPEIIRFLKQVVGEYKPVSYLGISARLTLAALKLDHGVDTGDSNETLIAYMQEILYSLWEIGRIDLMKWPAHRKQQLENLGISDVAARIWANGRIDFMYFPKVKP